MWEFVVPVYAQDVVLLLVRIMLVVVFAVAARNKFDDIRKFAKTDGLPVPVAYGVALAEAAAALAMLTGVLAQWAGIGLALLMLSTIYLHTVKWKSPYWASKGGWEYDVLMLILAAVIVVFGPGGLALVG